MDFANLKSLFIPEGEVVSITAGGVELWKGGYTNLAEPLPNNTTDTSKWVNGYRFGSSGTPSAEYAGTPSTLSNMIACKFGDIIRVKGTTLRTGSDRTVIYANNNSTGDPGHFTGYFNTNLIIGIITYLEYLGLENGVYTFRCYDGSNPGAHIITGFRFAMPTPTNPEDVIITVNEEIV